MWWRVLQSILFSTTENSKTRPYDVKRPTIAADLLSLKPIIMCAHTEVAE